MFSTVNLACAVHVPLFYFLITLVMMIIVFVTFRIVLFRFHSIVPLCVVPFVSILVPFRFDLCIPMS